MAAVYTWNELIKAIRCHYHRQKSPDNGKELLSSEEDSKESDTVSDNEENSQDDLVLADLDEQAIVQMPFLTFIPDGQTAEVTVQARPEWKMKLQKTPHTNKARAKTEKKLH